MCVCMYARCSAQEVQHDEFPVKCFCTDIIARTYQGKQYVCVSWNHSENIKLDVCTWKKVVFFTYLTSSKCLWLTLKVKLGLWYRQVIRKNHNNMYMSYRLQLLNSPQWSVLARWPSGLFSPLQDQTPSPCWDGSLYPHSPISTNKDTTPLVLFSFVVLFIFVKK